MEDDDDDDLKYNFPIKIFHFSPVFQSDCIRRESETVSVTRWLDYLAIYSKEKWSNGIKIAKVG